MVKPMVKLKEKLLVVGLILGLAAGVVAQKGNDNSNRRPDKNPPVVVVQPKGDRTHPNNQDKNKGGDKDKRGKP
jgi:hypothetical protein